MKTILAMPLSFKLNLLLKVYVRRYSNLVIELRLKHTLKAGFKIQGLE